MSESILYENFLYFKHNIEPYIFLIYNYKNEVIVIDVKKENFGHLVGYNKSTNLKYCNKKGAEIYKDFEKGNIKCLFDFIDKNRYAEGKLTQDELFIKNKNESFIGIFEAFNDNTGSIKKYSKLVGDDLDVDYLHVKNFKIGIGYLGIIGSKENNYHYFSSIIYEENRQPRNAVTYNVKRIDKVLKTDFACEDYTIIKSRRNYENLPTKKITNRQNKKAYIRKIVKVLNKEFSQQLTFKYGEFGSLTIQIYKSKKCIENRFNEKINDLSEEEIISYVKGNYI